MRQPLRILIVEDQADDAELMLHELRRAGFDPSWRRVETEAEYVSALDSADPALDVILSDFNLPTFDAPRALELLKDRQLDVPFIVVSGSIGEEIAVKTLQAGAADYLLKDRLARLGLAVTRALNERRLEREKRATEQQMRFALEATRVGTWEADLMTGAAHWSELLERLHGLPAGSFGGTFEAFLGQIHPADREAVIKEINRATREHNDSHILYRSVWPDGTTHWIRGVGRTFYRDDGTPVRSAGIGMDVTEIQALEEQSRQSQKMEAVGQLAGGIAHDFNNLLTAIQGYAALMSEELDPASPLAADLLEIRRAADRAAALTGQLLTFSRRQILEPRVLDLGDALRSIEPMLRRLIGEHIDLTFRTTGVGRVKADPSQMEQIILNLAINARDAMPSGGRLLIEIAGVILDGAYARQHAGTVMGPHVMLAVSDTGAGMDEHTRAHLFEPFFTTKPKGKGTGLGLSTVYGIVKQSGGSVWVYSEPGQGSTFKVYLPRVDEPASQTVVADTPASLHGSERILVVEDDPSVRGLIQKVLEPYGYQVVIAETPGQAESFVADEADQIDLLITDVVLPEMSGRELAGRLRARRPGLRVLYMSGYTDDDVVRRGVLDHAMPFLQKPFTPVALARKVRNALEDGADAPQAPNAPEGGG